jgi:sigma-E factor negative regulatory protein RseB
MMLRLARVFCAATALVYAQAFAQQAAQQAAQHAARDVDALGWLQRIYTATQKLSYTGTFVYQNGTETETSRITRIVHGGSAREKLETLDGQPREIVRSGDEVVCYLPASMTVKIDKQAGQRAFPAILPEQLRELSDSYVIRKGEIERVAGNDCQVLLLEPKDRMRYGQKLWADVATGMLLKAKTFNDRNDVMEQFTFTQIQIGGNIDEQRVRPRYSRGPQWRVENASAVEANLAEKGWSVRSGPPGFRKITEMTRTLGGTTGVGHIVMSDGLAAVSIFIEPSVARLSQGKPEVSRQGAINVFVRQLGEHRITVVGEAPADSVRFIANAVEYRKPRQ